MLIDTHSHINLLINDFDILLTSHQLPYINTILEQAAIKKITTIINVATNLIESKNSIFLAQNFNSIFASIGIHPTDWHIDYHKDIAIFKELLDQEDKIVAIGECGLDLYHKKIPLQHQIILFNKQIELALEYKKPLIIHSRDAYDETLKILEQYQKEAYFKGIIHCFSYDYDFAQTVIQWNFALGLGGTITYPKNILVRNAAIKIPLTSIVLETDAPFLPIQSMRGRKNHPQYIYDIAQYLAVLKDCTFEEVALETTKTARTLFDFKKTL